MAENASICVVGAGAIGGLIGAAFASHGHRVTLVDKNERLDQIRNDGLTVVGLDGIECRVRDFEIAEAASLCGPFDVVFLAVKAHQIHLTTSCLQRVVNEDVALVTLQNGLPWWYFQNHIGPLQNTVLQSVDPDGEITAAIPTSNIVGSVVYPAAEMSSDGLIRHVEGDRFVFGELSGVDSNRVRQIAGAFSSVGFRGQLQSDIRSEIWLKSWGSVAFNTISALSRATMGGICRMPEAKALAMGLMVEAESVANAVGVTMRVSLEKRLAGAERVGEHKTSMLQDVESGRQIEVEAIIGSILEIAKLTDIATPKIEVVHAILKLLNRQLGRPSASEF